MNTFSNCKKLHNRRRYSLIIVGTSKLSVFDIFDICEYICVSVFLLISVSVFVCICVRVFLLDICDSHICVHLWVYLCECILFYICDSQTVSIFVCICLSVFCFISASVCRRQSIATIRRDRAIEELLHIGEKSLSRSSSTRRKGGGRGGGNWTEGNRKWSWNADAGTDVREVCNPILTFHDLGKYVGFFQPEIDFK